MDVFSRPLVALHRPALIVRVGVALVSLVVALGLSLLFRLYFGSGTFLLFFGAVAIIAAYSGLPIALASVLISLALINYFLFPPFQAWTATPDVFARGVIFVFVACLISWLSETRRQATAQAYVQAERFFVTLSSIGDGVIVTDAARRITFLNPVAESLTGWSQSEAEGKDIADVFDIIDAETRQPVEHPVAHVLRDGTVVGLANHTLLRAKGGAERPIDDSGAPISDVSGHLIGVVVVFRDITARAESERERARLLAQEQSARTQLTTLLERITDGVAAFDSEWRYSYVNAQAAQLLRKTPEQLLGQRLWDVMPELVEDAAYHSLQRSMADQAPITYEWWYAALKVWFRVRTFPSPNGLTIFFQDITEQRQIHDRETAVQQRIALLAELGVALTSSLDYATTLQQLARTVVPVFADFCIVYMKREQGTIERVAVVHREPAVEASLHAIQTQDEIDPHGPNPVARVVRTGTPDIALSLLADDARERASSDEQRRAVAFLRPHSYILMPLIARGNTLGAISFIMTDSERAYTEHSVTQAEEIARRAALAIDNAQLYQQAQDAVRLRDQFLSIAAHELKTPLTSLTGQVQLFERRAQRDEPLSERASRMLAIISAQVRRLNKMVLSLLDVSRIESGQLSIEREPVDICTLARQVVGEVQVTVQDRQIDVVAPDEPLLVLGDALRLEQVLLNLVQNALTYSEPPASTTVTVTNEGDQICIVVQDRGMGIPADALPRLFTRFYRAENAQARHSGGMGIGLSVVKEIITLHGGDVQAESIEGAGSTFTIRLPGATELLHGPVSVL